MKNKCVILFMLLLCCSAQARDDGRYANSPLKPWFDSLSSARGNCCSFADGRRIDDADVTMRADGYYVQVDGQWILVPPDAVLTVPNKAGVPIVWPYKDASGKIQIRCFIPGAGT
jgi:hypothetical protein